MLERERLESKKISKTSAVTSIMGHELPADDVYIGPSDYVPWLTDRKWAHIRVEGQAFGDVPLNARGEARGVGLAELGRHRHRRGALLQAGAEPRPRRPARGRLGVPDEVAAGAGARTRSRATTPRTSSRSTAARRSCRARAARSRSRPTIDSLTTERRSTTGRPAGLPVRALPVLAICSARGPAFSIAQVTP